MKRIRYACMEQTIHFLAKEDMPKQAAACAVQNEVAAYKAQLERDKIRYQILEETLQSDGSMLVKLKKQYNNYNCGDYLD